MVNYFQWKKLLWHSSTYSFFRVVVGIYMTPLNVYIRYWEIHAVVIVQCTFISVQRRKKNYIPPFSSVYLDNYLYWCSLFVDVSLTDWCQFLRAWTIFCSIYSTDLLAVLMVWNVFISAFQRMLLRFRILDSFFIRPTHSTLNILSHCPPTPLCLIRGRLLILLQFPCMLLIIFQCCQHFHFMLSFHSLIMMYPGADLCVCLLSLLCIFFVYHLGIFLAFSLISNFNVSIWYCLLCWPALTAPHLPSNCLSMPLR